MRGPCHDGAGRLSAWPSSAPARGPGPGVRRSSLPRVEGAGRWLIAGPVGEGGSADIRNCHFNELQLSVAPSAGLRGAKWNTVSRVVLGAVGEAGRAGRVASPFLSLNARRPQSTVWHCPRTFRQLREGQDTALYQGSLLRYLHKPF